MPFAGFSAGFRNFDIRDDKFLQLEGQVGRNRLFGCGARVGRHVLHFQKDGNRLSMDGSWCWVARVGGSLVRG